MSENKPTINSIVQQVGFEFCEWVFMSLRPSEFYS